MMRGMFILGVVGLLGACSGSSGTDKSNWSGTWQRVDGVYKLEITVDASGQVSASYFNPNPIHVEEAAFRDEDDGLHLMVILNDTGYPRAVYNLSYDEESGMLMGRYYNPASGQPYQIAFRKAP